MKRTILIIFLSYAISCGLWAITYPVYRPAGGEVRPLWQQSPKNAVSTGYKNSGGVAGVGSLMYFGGVSQHNPILMSSGHSYSHIGSGMHSNIHAIGASSPVNFASTADNIVLVTMSEPKYNPPSTGDEDEPDPTKIETPIGDGTIFVLMLLLFYCINVGACLRARSVEK